MSNKKHERYYPYIDDVTGNCYEDCQVVRRNSNAITGDLVTKIGSVTCQFCPHCLDRDFEHHEWIVCDVIKEATTEEE